MTNYARLASTHEEVHQRWVESAKSHVDGNPLLASIGYDPSNIAHNLATGRLPADPDECPDSAISIAQAVCAGMFDSLVTSLTETDPGQKFIERVNERREAGGHTLVIPNHQFTYDAVIFGAATSKATLDRQDNSLKWPDIVRNSGIIASRMTTAIGVRGGESTTPATDSLVKGSNVFLAIPHTQTVEKLNIGPELIKMGNAAMLRSLLWWVKTSDGSEGEPSSKVLTVAISGSSIKTEGDALSPDAITIQRGNPTILRAFKGGVHIEPVALWYGGPGDENTHLRFMGPMELASKDRGEVATKKIQDWHALTLSDVLGIKTDQVRFIERPDSLSQQSRNAA